MNCKLQDKHFKSRKQIELFIPVALIFVRVFIRQIRIILMHFKSVSSKRWRVILINIYFKIHKLCIKVQKSNQIFTIVIKFSVVITLKGGYLKNYIILSMRISDFLSAL